MTSSNYIVLRESVPLASPLSVHVDPTNACNFRCSFCPTGNPELLKAAGRPLGLMKLPLFAKIIDDLRAFPVPVKSLLLYKDGEPLVNKRLPEMVELAKRGNVASVSTTTNAALLDRETSRALIDAGLDHIRISVEHVTPQGYREITRTFDDYEVVRSNVAALFEERNQRGSRMTIHAKIVDTGLSTQERAKFHDDFSPISDLATVDSLIGWSDTGDADMLLGRRPSTGIDNVTPLKSDRTVCPSPFKTMAINFNGEVSVCCVDWSHDTVVGDVSRESLLDIWRGEKLREFRLAHLRGDRHLMKACGNCQYVQGYPADSDLDSVATRLLTKLSLGSS